MKFFQTLLLAPLAAAKVSYDGYKVFHVELPDHDVGAMEAQLEQLSAVDVSKCRHAADHLDVAVPPANLAKFEALGLDYQVVNEDLGAAVKKEGPLTRYEGRTNIFTSKAGKTAVPSESWWDSYHPYEDHLSFIQDLSDAFNNTEVVYSGESVEGRNITGIHMWGSSGPGKEAVVFHANVHAREWITSMTAEYLAYQLLTADSSALDTYDFYIFPIVNPDGFVYTQTTARMWRKNRQERDGISAIGTDINRNWPYKWEGPGSSDSPGSETYRGEQPGDTPENKGLREFTQKLADGAGIKWYVDWHSYGQLILLPYGWSCTEKVSNLDQQMSLSDKVVDAIASVEGTQYTNGITCEVEYTANGGSNDYMQDVQKSEFAWAFELRDEGQYGFILPADQIKPNVKEIWEGVTTMLTSM